MKKLLLLILSFLLTNQFYAAEDPVVLLKKMQLALDKNRPEDAESLYESNADTLDKNWMALERLALSYEQQKKYSNAIDVFKKLILEFNKVNHQNVLATKDKVRLNEIALSTKLPYYYLKSAYINALLFKFSDTTEDEEVKKKYFNNAQSFILLCQKLSVPDVEIKMVEEVLNERLKVEKENSFIKKYFVTLDMISWQDRAYLKNSLTGSNTPLLSNVVGTAVGVGVKWENIKSEYFLDIKYALGSSTVSAENPDTYKQSSVSTTSLIMGPGLYYKIFPNNKALFGIYFPITMRKGDYTEPVNSKIEVSHTYSAGYMLQSKFYFQKFGLNLKYGRTFSSPGSIWMAGAIYDF